MAAQRGFPRSARLSRKAEYMRAFSRGEKARNPAFLCHAHVDPAQETRLGMVVSRKVGGAVVRNRVKRHVREFFRLNRARLQPGLQLVIVALPPSAALDGPACAHALEELLHRWLRDA